MKIHNRGAGQKRLGQAAVKVAIRFTVRSKSKRAPTSVLVAGTLFGLLAFVRLATRYPTATRCYVSTCILILNHAQTMAIVGSLGLEWPPMVMVIVKTLRFDIGIVRPECLAGEDTEAVFWASRLVMCAIPTFLLLAPGAGAGSLQAVLVVFTICAYLLMAFFWTVATIVLVSIIFLYLFYAGCCCCGFCIPADEDDEPCKLYSPPRRLLEDLMAALYFILVAACDILVVLLFAMPSWLLPSDALAQANLAQSLIFSTSLLFSLSTGCSLIPRLSSAALQSNSLAVACLVAVVHMLVVQLITLIRMIHHIRTFHHGWS